MNNPAGIRLIITDMDETLLTKEKSVSPYTLSVIAGLRERGILFSVCTGRVQPMTLAYARMLGLSAPYITANGALIWDPVEKKTLWEEPVPAEAVRRIVEFCEDRGIDYGVLTMGTSWFSRLGATVKRFDVYNRIAPEQGLPQMSLAFADPELRFLKGLVTSKVLIWNESMEKIPLAEQFLDTVPGIDYTHSQKGLIDIMSRGISKGTGVRRLAELLRIPLEQVCVFGDYYNDLPMFEAAGCSVAVGNAAEEVKKAAALVTKTNEEDGVAYAIRELLHL